MQAFQYILIGKLGDSSTTESHQILQNVWLCRAISHQFKKDKNKSIMLTRSICSLLSTD